MKTTLKPINVANGVVRNYSGSPIPPDTSAEDARNDVFTAVVNHLQSLGYRDTHRWEVLHPRGYAVCPTGALFIGSEFTISDGVPVYADVIEFSIEPVESTMTIDVTWTG